MVDTDAQWNGELPLGEESPGCAAVAVATPLEKTNRLLASFTNRFHPTTQLMARTETDLIRLRT
ncbi:MAG: hypothetical protein EBR86_10185 [Planctomycetia bacterium]|nr:hypothetical protein [Planctomycetia bacterium]